MASVTIGLPVYNCERFLPQSIESLLNQTFSDFVLIISDNASTDTTGDICRKYARMDSRVQYHRNERNIGLPANFNRVFELSDSPYLKWSTGDDFWAETMLERAWEIMEQDPGLALCYPRAVMVDAEGQSQRNYDDELNLMGDSASERILQILENLGLCHQLLGLVRTKHLRQTLLYGGYSGADTELLMDLSLYGKGYEIPERLYFRRWHEDSSSWTKDNEHYNRRYHSTASQRIVLTRLRHHLRRFHAVQHSSLPISEKKKIYGIFLKFMIWDRQELFQEICTKVMLR